MRAEEERGGGFARGLGLGEEVGAGEGGERIERGGGGLGRERRGAGLADLSVRVERGGDARGAQPGEELREFEAGGVAEFEDGDRGIEEEGEEDAGVFGGWCGWLSARGGVGKGVGVVVARRGRGKRWRSAWGRIVSVRRRRAGRGAGWFEV